MECSKDMMRLKNPAEKKAWPPAAAHFFFLALFSFLLHFLLLFPPGTFSAGAKAGTLADAAPDVTFLNDRASSVVGAAPLAAPGFVRPEGLTGAGQVVAIADSGLGNGKMEDPHPDLKSRPGQMPKVIMLKSWSNRPAADDPDGHGTHLAATVAGTGEASGGRFAGVAPGASIYFQAILGADGRPSPPSDLSALFAPAYAAAARIHLDGWGTKGNFYSAGAAQVDAFVRSHPDFLVVFGAGNDGPDSRTLTAEANSKNALVVGASEGARPAFGPGEDNAFEVARFSSRGPAADGRQKPDLVAPGAGIVSAASPLVKSNFPPNPLYTRMQGTSQAAAVTAGAAALLREYFQREEKIKSPSAALLKAALIATARPLPGDGAGFGRLDTAAAVIGLKEKTLKYSDEETPLTQGETRSFTYTVSDRFAPFTAVLAWTDPPAPAGSTKALVNDLDLRVKGPDGKEYLGNDDRRQGVRDDKNNVERVIIPYPTPGTYTVEIRPSALKSPQDFALVCGQPPEREIVSGYDARKSTVQFSSGKEAAFPPAVRIALGRTLAPALPENVLPGEDAYVTPSGTLYLAAEIFSSRAAQTIPLAGGTLFLEAGTEKREGGFYLRPGATVIANGEKLPGDAPLPAGVPAAAVVNPSAQTVWWVKADYRVKEGVLAAIDLKNRQLTLFNDPQTYRLDPGAAFSFTDTAVDGSRADLPYGAPVAGAAGQLAPGMPVQLVISPKDGLVVYAAVRRQLAVGEIKSLDQATEKITLAEGNTYQVITGAPVLLNGNPADFSSLKPGMNAALLLAGKTVIGIQAEEAVVYGQVVYFSAAEGRLYFLDSRSRLRTFTVPQEVEFFRWWQPGDTGSLLPGEWARLTLDSSRSTVLRIDVADARPEKSGRLLSYDPATRTVFFSTGDQALVASSSAVTKNGYPVHMEDFLPGEKVDFTLLTVPKSGAAVLGAAKGEAGAGAVAPRLSAACRLQGEKVTVSGVTDGEYVSIYNEAGGEVASVRPGAGGNFAATLPRPAGKTMQVVVTDRSTGGVAGMYVTIPEIPEAAPPETPAAGQYPSRSGFPAAPAAPFSDLAGHPAQSEIASLAAAGVLKGYPDGTFQPDRPVTRAEFTVMLVRMLNLNKQQDSGSTAGTGGEATALPAPRGEFTGGLPSWAAGDIRLAARLGLAAGYPDGTFLGDRPVTGTEALCLLARAAQVLLAAAPQTAPPGANGAPAGSPPGKNAPSFPGGWEEVPSWASSCVRQAAESDLFSGLPGSLAARLSPSGGLTRAEAALLVYHVFRLSSRPADLRTASTYRQDVPASE